MSIDRFVYVKPDPKSPTGRTYNWATVPEITDDLNNNHDGKEYGLHTVYVFQHGREYLYCYVNPEHAQEDFNTWRAEPLEAIQLKMNGEWKPEGRLPLTPEQIKAWQEAKALEEEAVAGDAFDWLG
jgi:hypothetical protein